MLGECNIADSMAGSAILPEPVAAIERHLPYYEVEQLVKGSVNSCLDQKEKKDLSVKQYAVGKPLSYQLQ